MKINVFPKNLKIRARFARTGIIFAVFGAARFVGYWYIHSLTHKVLWNVFVMLQRIGQNIFLPRLYSGNLSYHCFQGSGKVCCMPSVRVCFMCLPSVCCICVGRACMFSVCLLSMSVFLCFSSVFCICTARACVFYVCRSYVFIFCVPSLRVVAVCRACMFLSSNTPESPGNTWLTGEALWYLTN